MFSYPVFTFSAVSLKINDAIIILILSNWVCMLRNDKNLSCWLRRVRCLNERNIDFK